MKNTLNKIIKESQLNYVNTAITSANFPDAIKHNKILKIVPFQDYEIPEQAVVRLKKEGYALASVLDLAAMLQDNPKEIAKWFWVLTISEDSRWTDSDGGVYVPGAYVDGAYRDFDLSDFRHQLLSGCGVLVLGESSGTRTLGTWEFTF